MKRYIRANEYDDLYEQGRKFLKTHSSFELFDFLKDKGLTRSEINEVIEDLEYEDTLTSPFYNATNPEDCGKCIVSFNTTFGGDVFIYYVPQDYEPTDRKGSIRKSVLGIVAEKELYGTVSHIIWDSKKNEFALVDDWVACPAVEPMERNAVSKHFNTQQEAIDYLVDKCKAEYDVIDVVYEK